MTKPADWRKPCASGPAAKIQIDMADADKLRDANPWHPMTNSVDLKTLGKLNEELNECGAATARCMIQGVDEAEPVTGKINREWLEDEIADVYAGLSLTVDRFGLNTARIRARMLRKIEHLKQWHSQA